MCPTNNFTNTRGLRIPRKLIQLAQREVIDKFKVQTKKVTEGSQTQKGFQENWTMNWIKYIISSIDFFL